MRSLPEIKVETILDASAAAFFALKRLAKKHLSDLKYDLTMEQVIILHILQKHEGINIKDLAELADRDKTTISRMITSLEKKNLVVRVADKQDARQKLVYMTHLTRVRLEELQNLKKTVFEVAYKGLNEAELTEAKRVLEKIVFNLNER